MPGTDLRAGTGAQPDKVLTHDGNGNIGTGEAAAIPAVSVGIQSGSNSAGEWVRFADGTQICTAVGTLDYSFKSSSTFRYRISGGFSMPFAKDFVGNPGLSFNFIGGLSATAENARTTCRPYLIKDVNAQGWSMGGANTASYTDDISLLAIGRWK